jgi:hypothetical protein
MGKPQDAFSGLEFQGVTAGQRPYKNLVLALVLSENTKKSMDYVKAKASIWSQGADQNFIFTETVELLNKHFGSLVKVASISAARQAGAGAVMVLDIYSKTPSSIFHTADIRLGGHFVTLNAKPIDSITAEAQIKPRGVGVPAVVGATRRAMDRVLPDFEKKLVAAPGLLAFAGVEKSQTPVVALAAAPSKASKVDRPAYKSKEKADNFAVVVGVENYPRLPRADFAGRDAEAVRNHLVALGYPERNIAFLTGRDASKAGLAKHLEVWLPRNVKPNSEVFFYYSGHGAPDLKTGEAYLVPADGDPEYLEVTAYPIKRLYEKLGALNVKNIVVALDSCFSGAGGRSVIPEGTRPLVTTVKMSEPISERIVSLTAAKAEQISGTLKDEGHGLFTYFLLEGLNGAARDASGAVTMTSLYSYISPKVADEARRRNRDQSPQLRGPGAVRLR